MMKKGTAMRTLYVSDLDGTLLRSDETTSSFTNHVINNLVAQGMLFSYATARSYVTASKVTCGLNARIPVIVYNGAFVMDNETGEILLSNFFEDDVKDLLRDLLQHEVFPIVYAFVDGKEKFSYIDEKCTEGMRAYIDSRHGDHRDHPVECTEALFEGEIFYITCIDEKGKLEPLYEKYKSKYHAVFQRDIYTKTQWLEFMPRQASKSNAIRQLSKLLACDRVVVFGDGKNDVDMFRLADEGYAVHNAVDELKNAATAIIKSNDEDGVANWLLNHVSTNSEHF